ncbi:metallophosphoesterase [uncultured Treponema sp.]|uniref:metallophosphoesterase family protein n=1 Tax=uncultured Treponema sp. TaxID=162155 RepID=UPI0025EB8F13|nr:metallophosphoesterase [uncultured Treponema sp.]
MKFLVISDLHGNLEVLDKMDEIFKQADGVIFAGDFAKFGNEETGLPALEKLCSKHDTIFSVIGNCDNPSFIEETEKHDISVEKQLVMYEGLAFAGSGGGSKFTGTTPNEKSEEELMADFKIITEQGEQEWNNLIAVSHNPPKNTDCDKISGGVHVGSDLFTQFIEQYKPLAVVTGHIHESAGICKVGATTVINPGALLEGKYAWLEVAKENGEWKVVSAELKSL